jgi:glycolate oxidase FAD binding subunit
VTIEMPRDEADVAEAITSAAARGAPLEIRGGGTRGLGHPVAGAPLSLAALSGVTLYEPGALTLVARAGTPVAEIETLLAAEGQRLSFEPWDGRALSGANGTPTLGGMVAVNASGPRRIQAGACRDSLIGVRFVDGTGAVVKNGGRVMKNVTGLDLVKLLAGSHGTLGVLTEVAFKVLPIAERVASVVLDGLSPEAGAKAMAAAMGTPFDVTGAAHVPRGLGEGPMTLLRLEGFEGAVSHRIEGLTRALADFGPARVLEGPGDWARIGDMSLAAGRPGAIWRVSVKPSDGPGVGARLEAKGAEVLSYDWSGGLLTVHADEDFDLRAAIAGFAGHATLMRASEAAKARHGVFPPEIAPIAALSAGLRTKFDPKGVLNPGRMVSVPAMA